MALTLSEIECARERISHHIIETPLLRINNMDRYMGCRVYVKAECMQVTGSFKLRGALNKILSLPKDSLQGGIVTASSGNHGKAVAYACRMLGIKATIVLPHSVAQNKKDAIQKLGAEIVLCDRSERFAVAETLCRNRGGTLVPPFNDEAVMAGQGTAGLEIMEQCPELNMVVVPVSGGGLISGISAAVKSLSCRTAVYGAEPAALPRFTASLKAGRPVTVPANPTVADALISQAPGEICFPYAAKHTDAFVDVAEEYILKGMKLLLLEGKLLCEASSCIGLGAVLQGLIPVCPEDRVCFFLSGGSVSLDQLAVLARCEL